MQRWLEERNIVQVESIIVDMAGLPRGKLMPAKHLAGKRTKVPIALFGQTINGTYYMRDNNVEDRDMLLEPDRTTLRLAPWSPEPAATVMMDCFDVDGSVVDIAPREVLKKILAAFSERSLKPVVAPEIEFYLIGETAADEGADRGDHDSTPATDHGVPAPYGTDRLHDLGDLFRELAEQCRIQEIATGAVSQELGPGQFEVNFDHGDPLRLADDVLLFKRTLKRLASAHGLRATFLAKPFGERPGSSMHIHQSVYDDSGDNVFATPDGELSQRFEHYLGGLQKYLAEALLLFAPFPNSYRRYLSYWSSPVNLEWDIDNRTVGLRVPDSPPDAFRIENRLAGSDVNPYLAIAGTLACGLAGLDEALDARPRVRGSAYEVPFALKRHEYEAIDALRGSKPLLELLGADFIEVYTAVKERECREFEARIPVWERKALAILL